MIDTLTSGQKADATNLFFTFLVLLLSETTGELRVDEDWNEPIHWDLATYPKTIELLHDLIAEHCPY